jgi:hypothetical protein
MVDTILFLDDPAIHVNVHLVLGLYTRDFIRAWGQRQCPLTCSVLYGIVRDAAEEVLEIFHFRPQFADQPEPRNLQVCNRLYAWDPDG